ncbi:Thioesterase 1/protease 1/lysophospholipase L1 [Halioglobus japonicus]|nr:Thioesterase 1/protease 1/lysophospholipase L1 [Halioglobus japonicus]
MSYSQLLSTPRWPLAALLCILWLAACADRAQYTALPADAVVLAFGDSVTFGMGAGAGEDYPSRLAALSGLNVINAGISGDTAREAGSRLAPLLSRHQPDLVIIELGGNDFLRKTSPAQVKKFLQGIIREAAASGAVVALVSVPRLSLLRATVGALSDSDIYSELAEEEGVILVPDIFSQILSDSALRADEIHPNAQGYEVLAQGIYGELVARGLLQ